MDADLGYSPTIQTRDQITKLPRVHGTKSIHQLMIQMVKVYLHWKEIEGYWLTVWTSLQLTILSVRQLLRPQLPNNKPHSWLAPEDAWWSPMTTAAFNAKLVALLARCHLRWRTGSQEIHSFHLFVPNTSTILTSWHRSPLTPISPSK